MKTKTHGFTLIELMATLAVAAIVLSMGVPNMRSLLRNNQLTAATNTFVSSLNVARSEAIKQGRNATLCVSQDQATCSGTDWRLGWLAWVDSDSDGVLDAPGEIIRMAEPLPVSMTVNSAQSNFQVDAQGAVSSPNVTLTVCDNRSGETGRQLRIMATGGVSLNSQFGCS